MLTSIRHSLGRLSPTKPALDLVEQDDPGCDSQDTTMDMSAVEAEQWEPSVWGRLEVINRKGKVQGTLPIVDRECTIGRSSDNDLRCCEIGISRHACKIVFDSSQQARLVLVGSNKVTLNDEVVSPAASGSNGQPPSRPLISGDLIALQKYSFRFSYQEPQRTRTSAVFVPSSPSQSATMNTPNGKRRRVRMSLVHVADIETPNKQQRQQDAGSASPLESSPSIKAKRRVSLLAPGDVEATNNQAQSVPPAVSELLDNNVDLADVRKRGRQSIAVAPSTPRQEPFGAPQTEPRNHRIVATDVSLLFSGNGSVQVLDDGKGSNIGSPRSYGSPKPVQADGGHDEVIDEVVVLDDEEDVASGERRSEHEHATQGLGIEEPRSSPTKLRRRSSILDRVWPFGGGSSSSPVLSQKQEVEEPADIETEEQAYENGHSKSNTSLEEEAEVEGAEDLLPPLQGSEGPRLPRSMSSPGRLSSSPSFMLDGRRKVSLRTRTLLKSSAVLAEKLEAEAELGPETIVEQQEPAGSFAQLAEPFALRSEQTERDSTLLPSPEVEEQRQPRDSMAKGVAHEEEDEDEVDRSLTTSADQVPDMLSQARPSAYKRMSLPASSNAARRFSLFGGLPKLRSSSEAEDVVDSTRAERMGHARRKSSFEPSAMNGDLLRAPRDPSLSQAAYAQLRPPARDALRYLLSKKPSTVASPKPEDSAALNSPVAMSPVLSMSALSPAPSPATGLTPATPKYGALRELRLGRPGTADSLEQTRVTAGKRRSLILSPQISTNVPLSASTPPAASSPVMRSTVTLEETPDLVFLRQAMRMSESDIEGDTYVKALRHIFRGYSALLLHEPSNHHPAAGVDGLVTLLGSPAAHRALLAAAASVGRLSPQETAIQQAALTHAKHKKTRRGCRGGRRRSKSHNAAAGEGDDQVDAGADLAAPLESLELNDQDEGPDSAAVQRVQEIQHLLDRLGPLAPSGFSGQVAEPFAARHARRQSMGISPITAAEPIAEVAEESSSSISRPRKSFAAHDTSYDDVETDAEGEPQSEKSDRRKSTAGASGARSGTHRRGMSTASNVSNGSRGAGRSAGTSKTAGEESNESREREEAASVAGSEDSHGSRRQRGRRTNAGKGGEEDDKPAAVRSSSRRSVARSPTAEHDQTEESGKGASKGRVPRGPPPPPSIAKLTNGGNGGRHTRGRSTVSAEDPTSPVRTRAASASEDVQTSPVKPTGGRGGKKAPSAGGPKTAGGRKPSRRFANVPSDGTSAAASSDFPVAPESEPAYGGGEPTRRLRSGRVVGAGIR